MACKSTSARWYGKCLPFACLVILIFGLVAPTAVLGVRDEANQERWEKPTENGPDKEVPGFLVNLGPTGARAILKGRSFVVKYIFKGSPASGKLKINDEIVAANGKEFSAHTFGGPSVGYDGPMMDLGLAIEDSEGKDGKLNLKVMRGGRAMEVQISLEALGRFSATFPVNCSKTELVKQRAYKYLMEHPESWKGMSHSRSSVALALLASGNPQYETAAKKMILGWNRVPGTGTWSWNLSYQLITLAEYHLITNDKSVLPTIREIAKLLRKAQYKGKIEVWGPHGGADQATIDKHQALYDGGFGHSPYRQGVGNNGYGPMQFPTVLAVIAWQMAEKCGVVIDDQEVAIKAAFGFIDRGTAKDGHVAYGGEFTLNNGPIDWVRWKNGKSKSYVGRVGAALLAHKLSPEIQTSPDSVKLSASYLKHAHKSLPDGHACAVLGFSWGLLGAAASQDQDLMRTMYDYHKAWFNMARCYDGSFVVLPGRDYADGSYYRSSRYHLTGVMALVLGLNNPKLQIQGVAVSIPGVNHKSLRGGEATAYKQIVLKNYGAAAKALTKSAGKSQADSASGKMMKLITERTQQTVDQLSDLEVNGKWHNLKMQIAVFKPQFGGVPSYDQKVSQWTAAFGDKSGRLIVDADKFASDGYFGKAIKSLEKLPTEDSKFAKTAEMLKGNILKATQQVIDQMQQMEQMGQWYSLKTTLDKSRKQFGGVKVFDAQADTWAALLKPTPGRAIINAHKLHLDKSYGLSARALAPALADTSEAQYAKVGQVLMDQNIKATEQWVSSLMTLQEMGQWNALKDHLYKAKPKLAGVDVFDKKYATMDAALKSKFGRQMIVADRMTSDQSYGSAAKALRSAIAATEDPEQSAIAKKMLESIDRSVGDVLDSLTALEQEGDWYLLKNELAKWKRKLAGVESFDQKAKAWDAALRSAPIRAELKIGLQYYRLEAQIKKRSGSGSSAYVRQVEGFIKKYGDSAYGKKAEKLLETMKK
jgi:hypothetical protein